MFEIIALPKPSQLKESSVSDAIETPELQVKSIKYMACERNDMRARNRMEEDERAKSSYQ